MIKTGKKLILLFVGVLLLNISFALAAVNFHFEIDSNRDGAADNNAVQGQFDILVKVNVDAGTSIKNVVFDLRNVPGGAVTFNSATDGDSGLASNPAGGFLQGSNWHYAASSGSGLSGDLLLATIHATANQDIDVTFDIDPATMSAKFGFTNRNPTQTPLIVHVSPPAAQCTGAVPANANLCVGDDAGLAAGADVLRTLVAACTDTKCEYTCSANFANVDGNNANSCEVDLRSNINNCGAVGVACNAATQTCVGGVCTDNPPACNDGRENGDETDVDCGGSCADCGIGLVCALDTDCSSSNCQGGVCAAGPVCAVGEARCVDGDTREVCNAARDGFNAIDCAGGETCQGGVCQAQGKKQELKNAIDAINDADVPERWDIAFINRLARIIRDIFNG